MVVGGVEAVQAALDEAGQTVAGGIHVEDGLHQRGEELAVPLQLLVAVLSRHRSCDGLFSRR